MDLVPAGILKTGAPEPGALYFTSVLITSARLPPLGPHGLEGIWPYAVSAQRSKPVVSKRSKCGIIDIWHNITIPQLLQELGRNHLLI
jgi:hypothetical protein